MTHAPLHRETISALGLETSSEVKELKAPRQCNSGDVLRQSNEGEFVKLKEQTMEPCLFLKLLFSADEAFL